MTRETSGKPPRPSAYRAVCEGEAQPTRKHFAPAAERNAGPILAVLRDVVPETGRALEVASGTGQHVAAFAPAFPGIRWQPSDPDADARASIAAWIEDAGLNNVEAPIALDVLRPHWHTAVADGLDIVVCINLLHIAPREACVGLMAGAGRLLRAGGYLYLYGPYRRDGRHTAPSNAEFDRSLRARNPAWGVRDVEDVERTAAEHGFVLARLVEMPANNLSLLFRRAPKASARP